MKRRVLLAAGGMLSLASRVWAQPSPVPRIGYLSGRSLSADAHLLAAFREGLKEIGYVDGQNVIMNIRWAEGRYDQFSPLADELVKANPNVMVAVGGNAIAHAVRAATSTIPIVVAVGSDPIELGLVSNLSRPEGNLTGITVWAQELNAKRLDLLHEMLPSARNVALLMNPSNPGTTVELRQTQAAADVLGSKLYVLNAATESELDRALELPTANKFDALIVSSDAFFINARKRILAAATLYGLPAICPSREFAIDGGLASYGTRWADMYRLIGSYAGRILKGAKPADLPVQRPTTYELVINQKTARALGLTLPPAFLARVDEVIE